MKKLAQEVKLPDISNFLVIDAEFLLKTSADAFHECSLFRDASGRDITVAYGFIRDLLRLRQRLGINSGVVVFHKATVPLVAQDHVSLCQAFLREMQISTIFEGGCSFKTVCEALTPRPRWIISDDFNLAQMVGENLTLLMPGKDHALSLITPAYLSSHYGVSPGQIPDLGKSLFLVEI